MDVALALALWALLLEILTSWLVFAWAIHRRDLLKESAVRECGRMVEELRGRGFDSLQVGTHPWTPEDPGLSGLSGVFEVWEISPDEKMVRVSLRRSNDNEVYSLVTWIVTGIVR